MILPEGTGEAIQELIFICVVCLSEERGMTNKTKKSCPKGQLLYFKSETYFYFKPAILCSIVAIFAKASASFCFSLAKTFSGAPATNFSLDNFA